MHDVPARGFVRWRRLILLRAVAISILIGCALGLVSPTEAAVFNPKNVTLANGLQLVAVSDHRLPVVSHMVWYKVGAADEPPGHSGIAHLLEHLMFKGTPSVPQGAFSKQIARFGGQENAFTSYDYTAYYQNVPRDRLEEVMTMEADRMVNLTLTEAQVDPERSVVLEERSQRIDNDPASVLGEEAQAVRFLNHPYRRPIIGWLHEIEGLNADEVLDFYRHWYAPNNAIVVVSGDITIDDLRALGERTYGRLPAANLPARPELAEPPQHTERRVSLTDARVRQPSWSRSWNAPSYRAGETAQAYPLQVLAELLGGGSTSRLYRRLVVEQPLCVSAAAWYDPSARGPASFTIAASPRPGVTLAQIEEAVTSEINALVRPGSNDAITDEEVVRTQQRMAADAIYARDRYSTASHLIGEALAIGQSLDDVEAWPERIAAVDQAQVEKSARDLFERPGVTALLMGTGAVASAADPSTPEPSAPAAPPSGGGVGAIR